MKATLSSKGQLTIPKEVREYLKIKKGDQLSFSINKGGEVVMQAKNKTLEELWNILPKPERTYSIEEINESIEKGWANKL